MRLIKYTDEQRPAWTEFVRSHPWGSIFHSIAWKNVVEKTYRLRSEYHLVYDGHELIGVVPFFRLRGIQLRTELLSLPYAPYAGILLSKKIDEQAVLDALQWQNERVLVRKLNPQTSATDELVTMILDLPEDTETFWAYQL